MDIKPPGIIFKVSNHCRYYILIVDSSTCREWGSGFFHPPSQIAGEHLVVKWKIEINMSLTLDGDEECEEEERGEDEGGEGFVRENHLVNSFDS